MESLEVERNWSVLEFYAGIGGMHFALRACGVPFKVVGAFDINTTTNQIYAHNFPNVLLHQRNIQVLTTKTLDKINADIWTMSPPCQPFTRLGKKLDVEDRRTDSFKILMQNLVEMQNPPRFILLENVKGFETSEARELLIETLQKRSYIVKEYLLSPAQFQIPNSRPRYYALARRTEGATDVELSSQPTLLTELPFASSASTCCHSVGEYLQDSAGAEYELVPDKFLGKHGIVLDIVDRRSTRSSCFTKSYTQYAGGTGSVLCTNDDVQTDNIKTSSLFERYEKCVDDEERIALLRPLGLRFFTPREVANIMGFPSTFEQPPMTSSRQMYKALGNSINVVVVSLLLRYLLSAEF
uniref:tRNA (cytosine(38)-C(5))-methyltransferase n=1 Tax=Plectus sambesii TaxID=2011161 RepID=A0A914VS76_9BILA